MEDSKYNFDYNDFDPNKEYEIDNEKIQYSNAQLVAHAFSIFKSSEFQKEMSNRGASKAGIATTEKYGKAAFLLEWAANNPEEFIESAARGGFTQGKINKEQGLGICGLSDEERSINAKKGNKAFWDNATPEKIEAKYNKASNSMKKFIEENGYWRPVDYITPEKRKSMMENTQKTLKKKHIQKIKDFSEMCPYKWMTVDELHKLMLTIRECTKSTTRRVIYHYKESKEFFNRKKIDGKWYYRKIAK